ncbi:MAG TPA: ABC transporter substrate-binding protein [Chloroflexota bacterium]
MPSAPAQPTTLVMVINQEVKNLSAKAYGGVNPARTTRVFNAGLAIADTRGEFHPYLAESIPQLNTDTWRVTLDGRMETTWKLRPGLTWQDGTPLTADDFAFAYQVYAAPGLTGVFVPVPQNLIERVTAADPQTVRISWRSSFLHQGDGLEPLPRSILGDSFAAFEQDPVGQRDPFMAQRYWTTEYVGVGPFRLTHWEPGAQLEGEAFAGHALGRPKIDKIVLRIITDGNTVLAAMLAGQVQMVVTDVIGIEEANTLRGEGGFNDTDKRGTVIPTSTAIITLDIQHRTEYAQTPAIFDLRVRKAIAHSLDKGAIIDGLYTGLGSAADTFVRREAPFFSDVDRAITKYPYDPRKTEQFMSEAGFTKDREGFFADAAGQRFQPSVIYSLGPQREQLLPIMVSSWQKGGIDVQGALVPNAVRNDPEINATFPGGVVHGNGMTSEVGGAQSLVTDQIGTTANHWSGNNRGGWTNPDYDSAWDRYNKTVVRADQIQALLQMMKIQSDQLPSYPLYYLLSVVPHVSALKGPGGDASHWNIYEWELAGN